MAIDKITNLYRVNFTDKIRIISYLLKRVLKIKPAKRERDSYFLYMLLISENGIVKDETKNFYIIEFNHGFKHQLKFRKFPSSDILVYNQIYGYKEYEYVVNLYLKNFGPVSSPVKIIDAGGNIGLSSIYFMQRFPDSKVIIIEPEKENFEELSFNLVKYDNIIKINGALWKNNCKLNIVNDFRDKSDWAFRVEESKNGSVSAFSMDYLMKEHDFDFVDILKIDVEGAEKEIFTSKDSNLDFLQKTKCIAIEIHDEFKCKEQILQILADYGFSIYFEQESTIGINSNLLNQK